MDWEERGKHAVFHPTYAKLNYDVSSITYHKLNNCKLFIGTTFKARTDKLHLNYKPWMKEDPKKNGNAHCVI